MNDANYETVKMQVAFESKYARELQALKASLAADERTNNFQMDKIVELGTNIQSSMQGYNHTMPQHKHLHHRVVLFSIVACMD